jgi:hypothetical protein
MDKSMPTNSLPYVERRFYTTHIIHTIHFGFMSFISVYYVDDICIDVFLFFFLHSQSHLVSLSLVAVILDRAYLSIPSL